MRHSSIPSLDQHFSKQRMRVSAGFVVHARSGEYPRSIQRHLARKSANLGRAIKSLKLPSRHSSKKELARLNSLSKTQQAEFVQILSHSTNTKKQLREEERNIQSELAKKRVNLEDSALDIESVFLLPTRCKRRKWERSLEQSEERSGIPEEAGSVSMFSVEDIEGRRQEIGGNSVSIEDMLCFEPEVLFREVDNLDCVEELPMKEITNKKELDDNDFFTQDTNFVQEILELDEKEKEVLVEMDNGKAHYVPPLFAKVFSE
eukprot:TRINITY_DN9544_c0_g1_i3.p1 TRINITY_DN9544_c0_g1~~TRINITY_DN9544_c0_g1_i3.p1  ORF type:complete len:270 (+),score=60.93 TRINITY_DN9544_c0_g1_i3:29-811(+)